MTQLSVGCGTGYVVALDGMGIDRGGGIIWTDMANVCISFFLTGVHIVGDIWHASGPHALMRNP